MKTKTETGRSMVEMLGVLAVIGVLSIGGIMGYNWAMAKYKANEVSQAVRVDLTQLQTSEEQAAIMDPEVKSVNGATLSFFSLRDDDTYKNAGVKVTFADDDIRACKQFYDLYKDNPDYLVKVKCDGEIMGE